MKFLCLYSKVYCKIVVLKNMIKILILFGVRNDMFDGRYLYLFIGNVVLWFFNDYLISICIFIFVSFLLL